MRIHLRICLRLKRARGSEGLGRAAARRNIYGSVPTQHMAVYLYNLGVYQGES